MTANTKIVRNVMDSVVPITRFNRGEAGKIFEEVNRTGIKVVLKNNAPTCVLLDPRVYEGIMETIEDYALYLEAEERMKNAGEDGFITERELMEHLGITEEDLEDVEVDIEL